MSPVDPLAAVTAQGVGYIAVAVSLLIAVIKPILEQTAPAFSPKNPQLHDALLRALVLVLNVAGAVGWEAWAGHGAPGDLLPDLLLGVALTAGSLGGYHLVTSGGDALAGLLGGNPSAPPVPPAPDDFSGMVPAPPDPLPNPVPSSPALSVAPDPTAPGN